MRLAHEVSRGVGESERVARARAGDRGAFDALVRAHFPRVYGVLFRIVGNHEDAEDLAQECFARAFGALRYYRGEGAFEAWLLRIAVHLARDHARVARPRQAELGREAAETEAPQRAPWQEASSRELARGVALSLERLPGSLRIALVLRVLEEMEYEDVARVTGVRAGTARTQVMKARKLLARMLAPLLGRSEP